MREIKFRAWDKFKKQMIEDVICGFYKASPDYPADFVLSYADHEKKERVFRGGNVPYEVMQFTGLKDKNGKEIYEGDIVQYVEGKAIVEYYEGCFCCDWTAFNEWCGVSCTALSNHYTGLEVIGNIYQNPELLEGTK